MTIKGRYVDTETMISMIRSEHFYIKELTQTRQELDSPTQNTTLVLETGEQMIGKIDMSHGFEINFASIFSTNKEDVMPEMIFYNEKKKVTTLKFKDGTVTQSRPTEDDMDCYSREIGFLEALGKYIYGSRSQLVKAIESGTIQE